MPIENGTQFSWGEVKEKKEYLEDNYYSPDKTLNSSSFCGLKRLALNEDAAAHTKKDVILSNHVFYILRA